MWVFYIILVGHLRVSYKGASPNLVEIGSWSDYGMKIAKDKTRLCPREAPNAKYLVNIPYKWQCRWARGQPGVFSHQPPEHFVSLLLFFGGQNGVFGV